MIIIANVSNPPTETGNNTYSLRINREEILQFTHRRELSLSTCLRAAADAYDIEAQL